MSSKKTGRLDGFQLLPSEADMFVERASADLIARRRPQVEIYTELAESLEKEGIAAPSFSSFNRFAIKVLTKPRAAAPAALSNFSQQTLKLAVALLRSLADDLEAQTPDTLSRDDAKAITDQILGLPQ